MQHGQALRARGTGQPYVVGYKGVRVVADAESGGNMDRVERAKVRVLERCRASEDRLIKANENEAIEQCFRQFMRRTRPSQSTQSPVHFDSDD